MIKFRTSVRIFNRLLIAAFLVLTPALSLSPPASAAQSTTVIWPVDVTVGAWSVVSGYNITSGANDHGSPDNYSQTYGLDLFRSDLASAPVRSPVSGTITGPFATGNGVGQCYAIKFDGAETREASVCHVDLLQSVNMNTHVNQGQPIGTITPDGGNTHVHFNIRENNGGSYSPIPFTGLAHIEGCPDYPPNGTGNQYTGDIKCSEKQFVFPNEPGGWWLGPTPDDGSPLLASSTVPINVHAEDKTGSGLQKVDITWHNETTNSVWSKRTKWLSGNPSQTDFSTNLSMPEWGQNLIVSFDVYTNNGKIKEAPQGMRRFCSNITCSRISVPPPGGGGSSSSGGCVPGQYQAAVFTDPNYGGSCVIKGIGEYPNPESIGLPNDSISSIKVGSGANVRLCANDGLNTPCEYFSQNDDQLNYFDSMPDNATSSMKVEGGGPTTNCQPGESEVAFFMNENYQETCTIRGVGRYDDPSALGLPNDTISSVKIGARVKVRICDNAGNNSPCDQFENNVPDLTPTTVQNNKASSAEVTLKGGIALCDNTNYGGECKYFGAGDTGENLQNMSSHGFDNRIESVRYDSDWAGLYHIVLYTDQNQTGYLYHADNSSPNLNDPYNNNISSIKIYKNHPPNARALGPATGTTFPATTTSVTLNYTEGQEKRVHVWNASGYDVTSGWSSSETYTPTGLEPGTYSWQAQSRSPYVGEGAWSAVQTFSINTPPTVVGGSLTMDAGTTQSIQVQAYDSEQSAVTLTASGLPSFATFTDNSNGTATLALNPSTSQGGQYAVTVTASDGSITGTATVDLTVTGPAAPPVTLSGMYKLVNPQSGKVLDVDNGGTWDGAVVHLWSEDNGADQQWQPVQNGDGSYKLVNPNSGKVLDVDGGNTNDGTKVQLWTDNGSGAQQWNITQNTDGTYTLTNINSDKVLDVNAGSSDNGTKIQIWTPNESGAQKWQFVQLTPPSPTEGYQAEYFNNTDLSGVPVLSRSETAIDYDWGGGSPHELVNEDDFSGRWTRTSDFAAGGYNFTVRADDGVRLFIDGQIVIDEWVDQGPTTYTANRTLTAGSHTISVEYYDSGGGAVMEFDYAPGPTINPGDYTAMYFDNQDLDGAPVLVRGEATIDHDWGQDAPDPSVPDDWFSARYVKTADFAAGTYRFTLAGDDGVRLFIDGQTVIDEWEDHDMTAYVTDYTLSAGPHEIVVDYYDAEWDATVNFGYDLAPAGTNHALTGTGYRWWKNTSATSNSNRVAASMLNNNNTLDEIALRGSTSENANAWEGAGVVWSSNKTISHFEFFNGARDNDDDGVFTANFKLQFTTDGTTWTNATTTSTPGYDYDSAAASGKVYRFDFSATSVRGVRVVGQVRTTGASSWLVYAREVRAY